MGRDRVLAWAPEVQILGGAVEQVQPEVWGADPLSLKAAVPSEDGQAEYQGAKSGRVGEGYGRLEQCIRASFWVKIHRVKAWWVLVSQESLSCCSR